MTTGSALRVRARVAVPLDIGGPGPTAATLVTFEGLDDGLEHLAVVVGNAESQSRPLVRVHSECLTGDVLGSRRCDCGPQLREALSLMSVPGGILLYLRQEGRGIGLYNKVDAYRLQDGGLDTFEANRALSFADDERDYTAAAQMLAALGVVRIRLLTNNPDKVDQLRRAGLDIESEPTGTFLGASNERYLRAKHERTLHTLSMPTEMGAT